MQIIINISEEGKVTTEIQEAEPTDESVVYSSPWSGEATFPINEVAEGQSYDGGAASIALEADTTAPSDTAPPATPTTESGDLDGGKAPQS